MHCFVPRETCMLVSPGRAGGPKAKRRGDTQAVIKSTYLLPRSRVCTVPHLSMEELERHVVRTTTNVL
jgi:hypothetical protein